MKAQWDGGGRRILLGNNTRGEAAMLLPLSFWRFVFRISSGTYTGCPRRNVPDFGRVFLMLKYMYVYARVYWIPSCKKFNLRQTFRTVTITQAGECLYFTSKIQIMKNFSVILLSFDADLPAPTSPRRDLWHSMIFKFSTFYSIQPWSGNLGPGGR